MTRKIFFLLVFSAIAMHGGRIVSAQSFLDKLEGTLREGLDNLSPPNLQAPATSPAIDAGSKAYLGLVGDDDRGGGVRVLSVKSGASAEAAGLRANDLITAVDGKAVTSMDDLGSALSGLKTGERAEFRFVRDGLARTTNVTFTAKPVTTSNDNPFASPADPPQPATDSAPIDPFPVPPAAQPNVLPLPPPPATARSAPAIGHGSLGITVSDVDSQTRLQYRLAASQGAVVTSVKAGSPAANIGLAVGSVIVAFDGRRVATSGDIVREMQATRAGQRVELTYYVGPQLRRSQILLDSDNATAAPADAYGRPRFSLQPNGQRGPILDRVERLLDNIVPSTTPVAPPTSVGQAVVPNTAADSYETTILRTEIESMQAQIDQLQKQVIDLQQRLKAAENRQP